MKKISVLFDKRLDGNGLSPSNNHQWRSSPGFINSLIFLKDCMLVAELNNIYLRECLQTPSLISDFNWWKANLDLIDDFHETHRATFYILMLDHSFGIEVKVNLFKSKEKTPFRSSSRRFRFRDGSEI